jgi:ubiquinone/menaquinone biosynthesis C-methylase UbiE
LIYHQFAKSYEAENFADFDLVSLRIIKTILSSSKVNPKSCLDLACGNGVASVILAKKGMKVVGVDLSDDMLSLARKRSKKAGLKIDFVHADMRNFRLDEKVDLAICLYDSLNYLLKSADLKRTFRNVHDSLSDKGLVIFDMNTRKTLKNWTNWHSFNENWNTGLNGQFDSKKNLARLHVVMFVRKDDGNYRRFVESHVERAYPKDEIRKTLENAEFSNIRLSDFPGMPGRLLGVAQE